MKRLLRITMIILAVALLSVGCQPKAPVSAPPADPEAPTLPSSIILATTTSTYDSGLLHYLLPKFAEEHGIEVEVISVGTGAAIEIGKSGDCDVILVHARALEDAFVSDGFGTERYDVMYNDYVYVGPREAAVLIESEGLTEALLEMASYMAQNEISFLSRGDNSGTHNMEKGLWPKVGLTDYADKAWYLSIGQGMGDTLVAANEMGAFTLADRGTYLAMQGNLPNLQIVFEGDDTLFNPYGIIPVNPAKHAHVEHEAAMLLVEFLISDEVQADLLEFGVEDFGQPLFFPNASK
ncbi:MAG TPA: substrate-binding domain-containing protein [Bacillota bacterium]|nr:substrate-binding domain-containing protein [Bacillota bacterium]